MWLSSCHNITKLSRWWYSSQHFMQPIKAAYISTLPTAYISTLPTAYSCSLSMGSLSLSRGCHLPVVWSGVLTGERLCQNSTINMSCIPAALISSAKNALHIALVITVVTGLKKRKHHAIWDYYVHSYHASKHRTLTHQGPLCAIECTFKRYLWTRSWRTHFWCISMKPALDGTISCSLKHKQ